MEEHIDIFEKDLQIVGEIINSNYTKKNYDYENLAVINDRYLRSLCSLFLERHEEKISKSTIENNLKRYKELKAKFEKLEDEGNKTSFVVDEVNDNNMKLAFLSNISSAENRKTIIESFECEIDPEIENEVILVQKMIREYFSDMMGDKLTPKMKERMEIVFRKTSVQLSETINENNTGFAYYFHNLIHLNQFLNNNSKKIISVLTHEYGHHFSEFYYATEGARTNFEIEESTQDLFSELVINNYLEKHAEINVAGKKVDFKRPFVSWSGYYYENAFQRTALYPLEEKGLVHEAIANYQLGSKNDYYMMVFGNDVYENMEEDSFGNRTLNMDFNSAISQFYDSNFDCFQNINRNSILYRRNWILPVYELQNIVYNDVDLLGKSKVDCSAVAESFFNGRFLHEISKEELEEFENLFLAQQEFKIINYDDYANSMINRENDEQRNEFSYEILNNLTVFWNHGRGLNSIDYGFYNQIASCCNAEIEKSKNQTGIECTKKYKALIHNLYFFIRNIENSDPKEYLKDSIDSLKINYLTQIDKDLDDDKKRKEIISELYDSEKKQFFVDDELLEILQKHGIDLSFELQLSEGKRSKSLSGKFTLKQISKGIAEKKKRKIHSNSEEVELQDDFEKNE